MAYSGGSSGGDEKYSRYSLYVDVIAFAEIFHVEGERRGR